MLVILAPSKTQSVSRYNNVACSEPLFSEQADYLASLCRKLSTAQIMKLMNVSEQLAEKTHQKFSAFQLPHSIDKSGHALATFRGDVFVQMKGTEYTAEELQFAQRHVRILSGLYGILRPLDLMQPYRLEMGARLTTSRGSNLYQFWGELLAQKLNEDLAGQEEPTIIDCASREYSRSIIPSQLNTKIVTMNFKQKKNNIFKSIAIYAKRARGMFVDWLITNRIDSQDQLIDFSLGGYRFSAEASSDLEYVFVTCLDG